MLVEYQTTIINNVTYITGYYACAPDNPNAVSLDSQLDGIMQWIDENGNPIWALNDDGSIGTSTLLGGRKSNPSSIVSQMSMPDLLAQIPEEIVQVINAVVNNIPLTTDQIDAWNIAYTAHENAAQIDVTENKQSAALTLETG